MLLSVLVLFLSLLAPNPFQANPVAVPDSTRPPYLVFTGQGEPSTLDAVLEAMAAADVVYVGESHDDSVAHAIETELLQKAFARYAVQTPAPSDTGSKGRRDRKRSARTSPRSLVLAMEMFERDVQLVLDEYLAGLIRERDFLAASRPWGNYASDYRPLVEFARIHKIPVVATNAPARYVSRVGREGPASLAALDKTARTFVAPLDVNPASEAYGERFRQIMQDMMAAAMRTSAKTDSASAEQAPARPMPADTARTRPAASDAAGSPSPHGTRYTLDAQNLRDATMAYSIVRTLESRRGAMILHVNGSFHSNFGLGTPEHTARMRPKTRQLVVALLSEGYPHFDPETMRGAGDFVLLTDPAVSGHEAE